MNNILYYTINKESLHIEKVSNNNIDITTHWCCGINENVFDTEEERIEHLKELSNYFKSTNNERKTYQTTI